jgi:hypothetical protein
MTIKAQDVYFWGLWKRPVRELKVGDTMVKDGLRELFSTDSAVTIARVVNPDLMSLHQKLIGLPIETNEIRYQINMRGRRTSHIFRDEITQYGSTQSLGDMLTGIRTRFWWEPTPEQDMSPGRRK